MTCDLCTRALAGACIGEASCAALHLSDEDACVQAAEVCLSWWLKRDEMFGIDDALWEMSEQRIADLASDPQMARAYLATMNAD